MNTLKILIMVQVLALLAVGLHDVVFLQLTSAASETLTGNEQPTATIEARRTAVNLKIDFHTFKQKPENLKSVRGIEEKRWDQAVNVLLYKTVKSNNRNSKGEQ